MAKPELAATVPEGWLDDGCPVRELLGRLGDKWTMLVVGALEHQPRRFGQLHRAVPSISRRMLTVTLRQLERDGLVTRTVIPVNPPQVEYALSALGVSLTRPIHEMITWALDHKPLVDLARDAYDRQSTQTSQPDLGAMSRSRAALR